MDTDDDGGDRSRPGDPAVPDRLVGPVSAGFWTGRSPTS